MNSPFSDDIIGSWLFVRSTKPDLIERYIYHFANDGQNYWEFDLDGERQLHSAAKFKFSGNTLTLIFPSGSHPVHHLTQETDGTVKFPNSRGDNIWWMIRLCKPEIYSLAFVDSDGFLQKFNTTEQGAATNP